MRNLQRKIEELLPTIKKNISLRDYTTFRIGGKAKYFFIANTKEDIIKAIKVAKEFSLPFFILGGGSNILFSDKGFKGMIIKIQNVELKVQNCNILTGAGTPLSLLVQRAKRENLSGLEWATGIPGTVGGAIYGNASAFGKSIGDIVKWVEVLNTHSLTMKKISKKNCRFGYKDSIFKHKNFVILSAELALKKAQEKEIENQMRKFLSIRDKTQPVGYPCAGCIFKNLNLNSQKLELDSKLFKRFPELKDFIRKEEIPAGYLIDRAKLKGKRIGDAIVSEKHANFIINLGRAKAEDVRKLINHIKKEIKKIFGVKLEEEIISFPH